ncbi:hypothetical protein NP233_g7638 [Leucocoprinus birnbaumii]|uniref:Ricin B lectin domain-containing protein n=1 Tax=Leucocoprinus birnbaumii TaxID=56174 RepID=A0AAD5VP24_9AGAR|nr:hypothetical protein NP233_g11936 [Leucocoprinus birnbaumii]KAJ3565429.1 hypothetical protein NP233_g7638 [Leucocoprinus birnbaumii]
MLAKIPLTILSLSALAAAQTIQICNQYSIYCIRMETLLPQPGDPAVWFPPSMWYAQRWIFTDDGYLINGHSGLVLEAPVNSKGNLIKGKGLVMKEQVAGALNQQWKFDDKKRFVSKKNESMAISGRNGVVKQAYSPLALYPANDTDPNQVFRYYGVMPQVFGTELKCKNILGERGDGLCPNQ